MKTETKSSKAMTSKFTMKNKVLLSLRKHVAFLLIVLLIPILAYWVSVNYYQVMLIQGDSMLPSYHNMEFVLLDKHSHSYTYGDVIAFECEGVSGVLVKRIAACPMDEVVITDGTLYVNGVISHVYPQKYIFEDAGILEYTIRLSETEYFVIGDNSNSSKDSRDSEIGLIAEDSILGKIK